MQKHCVLFLLPISILACGIDTSESDSWGHPTGDSRVDPCLKCNPWEVCENDSCNFNPASQWNLEAFKGALAETNQIGEPWDTLGGMPDPYVCITANGITKCSVAVQDTLKPEWNMVLHRNLGGGSIMGGITVGLYDEDLAENDVVCEGNITVKREFFDAGGLTIQCDWGAAAVALVFVK